MWPNLFMHYLRSRVQDARKYSKKKKIAYTVTGNGAHNFVFVFVGFC